MAALFSSCSTTTRMNSINRLLPNSISSSTTSVIIPCSQVSVRSSFSTSVVYPNLLRNNKTFLIQAAVSTQQAAPAAGGVAPAIALTDDALKHLNKMRSEKSEDLCLRIGVKQGGCSGMSYTMEFESKENTRPDDTVMEYNGFVIVCDPKSLLFIFGMQLDFSDALIGGGFSFKNPNATQTCGCGKSFASEV